MELTSKIIAYELGELNHEQVIELFQELINSGLIWYLQGHYVRMVGHFIAEGLCYEKEKNLMVKA